MKRAEAFGFGVNQSLHENGVNAASARAFVQSFVELGQVRFIAGGNDLNVTVFGIADPAAKVEGSGFAMNEPAKSYALDAAFDELVVDHEARSVLQMMG
jgi:hypothetical protein